MKLTDKTCKNAKPGEKPYKLFDGGGLYLEVMPTGSKLWHLKYRFLGKEKRLAMGPYPRVSLAEAREKREKAKKQLEAGQNPSEVRKKEKWLAVMNATNTFEAVAREWHSKQVERWETRTGQKIISYLENDILPYLGSRPIADIDPPELLDVLRKIEARKTPLSTHTSKKDTLKRNDK